MTKPVIVFIFFCLLFTGLFSEEADKKVSEVETPIILESEDEYYDGIDNITNELEESVKNKESVEEKIVTERRAIFEIGTYSMSDSIHKTTRNNNKKYELKKGDRVIITQKGTNYDGTITFEVIRKGMENDKIIINIDSDNMPIYALKEYK